MASPFATGVLPIKGAICFILAAGCFGFAGRGLTIKPDFTVRSNTAVEYFRVGVVIGATVERAKPGLTPQLLLPTALQYYGSLGPDPLLIVPQKESEVNLGKAAGALNKLKPMKANGVSTNLEPDSTNITNTPYTTP